MAKAVSAKRIMILLTGSLAVLVAFGMAGVWMVFTQPIFFDGPESEAEVSAEALLGHVTFMVEECSPRNSIRVDNLDRCAAYILTQMEQADAQTSYQSYELAGNTYRNVIGMFGPTNGARVVVGAHYDVCRETPGADDNASGTAVLIELAFLLGKEPDLAGPVELVAYTLEEPPYFASTNMGSARHAAALKKDDVELKGMISLEMVGYYSDEPNSQVCPSPLLETLYPDRGNFIAIVGLLEQRSIVRTVKRAMKGAADLRVLSINAPDSLPGIDFSDHRNYWNNGYDAVMITDTAEYRNRNYHRAEDTVDTLDYERMSDLTVQVLEAVKALTRRN